MDLSVFFQISHLSFLFEKSVVFVLPFFVCMAVLQLLARFAVQLGIVDKPDRRKQHEGFVPLVGGLSMFAALAISSAILALQLNVIFLLGLMMILVVTGYLDDRFDLSARIRLAVQIVVALLMVYVPGIRIVELGDLFGLGEIAFGEWTSVLFTVICAVGVINAINMIDGLDGLAGSVLFVSFCALATVAVNNDQYIAAKILFIATGTLAAFLLFNARIFVRHAMVFMGDSGSMALGLLLTWFLVRLSQPPVMALSTVAAGWIFGLPLLDTIAVIARRLASRRNPMAPARDHLHHLLLTYGMSVNQTVGVMVILQGLLALGGIWLNNHRSWEPLFFWVFVALVLLHFAATPRLLARARVIRSA